MALQEFVKKVFSDEQTKQQFLADPKGVISHFALTEKEKSAVLKTHANFGIVTSSSPQMEAAIILPLNGWLLFRCRKELLFWGGRRGSLNF